MEYSIRPDYQAILDICVALEDAELSGTDKAEAALWMFYPDAGNIPPECREEALEQCFWFIDGGRVRTHHTKSPRLVDWEKDFPYICGPVNRVLGLEVRAAEHMHWWTFLAAYMEIIDSCHYQEKYYHSHTRHEIPVQEPPLV